MVHDIYPEVEISVAYSLCPLYQCFYGLDNPLHQKRVQKNAKQQNQGGYYDDCAGSPRDDFKEVCPAKSDIDLCIHAFEHADTNILN